MQTQETRLALTPKAKLDRTIRRLLVQHNSDFYTEEDGTCVMLVHCARYHRDREDPLYGQVTWITELVRLENIRTTMAMLGY